MEQDLFQKGKALYEQAKYHSALMKLETAFDVAGSDSERVEILRYLGLVHFALRNPAPARRSFTNALILAPGLSFDENTPSDVMAFFNEVKSGLPTGDVTLDVTTDPAGAVVNIDRYYYGHTPLTVTNLRAGSYMLEFELEYFDTKAMMLNTRASEKKVIKESLTRLFGGLVVLSDPGGADVFIDGSAVGTTPLSMRDVPAGLKSLEVHKEGYYKWTRNVEVLHGQQPRIEAHLEQIRIGRVSVVSDGLEGTVFIDEERTGPLPLEDREIRIGSHDVRVEFADGDVWEGEVEIIENEVARVEVAPQMQKELVNSLNIRLLWVPAGDFEMGSTVGDPDEAPAHKVSISNPIYISEAEISNFQFAAFVEAEQYATDAMREGKGFTDDGSGEAGWEKKADWTRPFRGGRDITGKGSLPVTLVTWNDAHVFCEWLSRKEGLTYRLPTEAEWEYAATGGRRIRFPWGNQWREGLCNIGQRINDKWQGDPSDSYLLWAPVKLFSECKSPFGLYDMAGNLWEWCLDWYQEDYYASSPGADPGGPAEGKYRVIRGGAWNYDSFQCRATNRAKAKQDDAYSNIGFRIVMVPERVEKE
ncbi:SUMF1/EgtB/PvdO family nonheme iron enzyme [Thermodesulfobacteriota bacterium]